MSERKRLMLGSLAAALSTAFVLSLCKGYAWYATGSAAMLGALADSLTDCLVSGMNFVAVRAALRPADDNHRFGHGKFEALAALAQCLLIAAAAVFIAREGVDRFLHPAPAMRPGIGLAVGVLSLVLTGVLVRYQTYVARQTRSPAIKADRMHYTTDLWSNGLLTVNFLTAGFSWQPYLDAILTLFAAFKLAEGCYEVLCEAAHQLTDAELPEDVRRRIYDLATASHPQAAGLHDLRTRLSGGHMFVQFHLELPPEMTVREAHAVLEAAEAALHAAFPQLEVFIHLDPSDHPKENPTHFLPVAP